MTGVWVLLLVVIMARILEPLPFLSPGMKHWKKTPVDFKPHSKVWGGRRVVYLNIEKMPKKEERRDRLGGYCDSFLSFGRISSIPNCEVVGQSTEIILEIRCNFCYS